MLFNDPTLLYSAIAPLLIYLVSWVVYCRYFHPLRSLPGPFLASISRVWIVYKTMAGDIEHTQRKLHKKHGYLVRIAPNEVVCSDPEAIKIIYDHKTVFLKTDFYDAFAPPTAGYVGHFSARDEKEHSQRRRIVNSVYSMSSVLESEQAIDSCTQLLCETMREFATEKVVVDLGLWINMYAYDVLGELFFGKMFGFMRERTDIRNYMKAVQCSLPGLTIAGVMPSYLSKLYLISTALLLPSFRGALGPIKHLASDAEAAVRNRKEQIMGNKDDGRDILRKMLEINADRGEEIDFTLSHIGVESISAIFAGADTTAIAINSILYYLMRNAAAYEKLVTEIDAAVADGSLSMPMAYREAVKLPYLKACVNEAMRLHPGVGLPMPRLVPTGGANISSFHFPEGYRVGINGAVVQYDKGVFGADADNFNPDRWIKGDAVRMEKAMIQFGAGPRTCIGKNISLSEIYKLIPQILRSFHIRLVDPSKEWKTRNYWFNKQTDIHIYVEERLFNSN